MRTLRHPFRSVAIAKLRLICFASVYCLPLSPHSPLHTASLCPLSSLNFALTNLDSDFDLKDLLMPVAGNDRDSKSERESGRERARAGCL